MELHQFHFSAAKVRTSSTLSAKPNGFWLRCSRVQSIHQDYCENTSLSSSEDRFTLGEHSFLTTEEAKLNSNFQAVEFFSNDSETLEQTSQSSNEKKMDKPTR